MSVLFWDPPPRSPSPSPPPLSCSRSLCPSLSLSLCLSLSLTPLPNLSIYPPINQAINLSYIHLPTCHFLSLSVPSYISAMSLSLSLLCLCLSFSFFLPLFLSLSKTEVLPHSESGSLGSTNHSSHVGRT